MAVKKYISFFILLTVFLNIASIIFVLAEDDYELEVSAGTSIVWEITEFNDTLIQKLIDYEDYSSNLEDFEKEYQFKWEIYEVDGGSTDYWYIEYYYYEGLDIKDSDDYDDSYYTWIAKDPEELAESSSLYSTVILPTDVADYLEVYVDTLNDVYTSVDERTLIINNTLQGDNDTIIFEYNKDGIQKNYSLYYDGDLAYRYELEDVSIFDIDDFDEFNDPFFITVTVLIATAIIVAIFIIIALFVKKARVQVVSSQPVRQDIITQPSTQYSLTTQSRPLSPSPPAYLPPIEPGPPEVKVIGYCPLCGSDRDSDSLFCSYCGNKF